MVEVTEPVFARPNVIEFPLQPQEMEAVGKIASVMGLDNDELIRQWVLEKLDRIPHARLAQESAKLDPVLEQEMADEDLNEIIP